MAPPSLQFTQTQEQKQQQVLDARQLQSLKIMQKPLQELREDIRAELESNPVLEEVAAADALAVPGAPSLPDEDAGDTADDRTGDDYTDEIDRYEAARDGTPAEGAEAADRHARLIDSLADRTTLEGRLLGQLHAEGLSEAVRRAGEYLVGSMDPDGGFELAPGDLAREAGVTEAEAAEAIRIVRALDYGPARTDDAGIAFLVPEVAILRTPDGTYTAEPVAAALPDLRLSRLYLDLAAAPATDAETRRYLADKIRSGEFWIKSLARRSETLLAIAREIARVQGPFFDHGLSRLKPMTLAEMGERVGLHETTVGRAIDGKSALTPQGTCPLRLFFTHGVRKASGEASASVGGDGADDAGVSTLAIRAAIQQMVRGENPRHPLSDQAMADALRGQGYPVARRTVAKYREQLGIAPSHLRK